MYSAAYRTQSLTIHIAQIERGDSTGPLRSAHTLSSNHAEALALARVHAA